MITRILTRLWFSALFIGVVASCAHELRASLMLTSAGGVASGSDEHPQRPTNDRSEGHFESLEVFAGSMMNSGLTTVLGDSTNVATVNDGLMSAPSVKRKLHAVYLFPSIDTCATVLTPPPELG